MPEELEEQVVLLEVLEVQAEQEVPEHNQILSLAEASEEWTQL